LIDLEQQAEFFVVLGQDDAAIDLLVAHLRDTGGASPLPYLKLLDIYRRLGDHEAYERTRDRFNHRFNAHAPAWDATGGTDRVLEDYADVVRWIQRVWPKPLDAMAELESLLFRKDGGANFSSCRPTATC
jgi:pilus assembly protein FimV